jgi:hypothetical protein
MRVSRGCFAVLLWGVVCAPVVGSASVVPEAAVKNIEAARGAYGEACRRLDEKMTRQFTAEIERARRANLEPDRRARLVECLTAERAAFQDGGVLGFSAPMRAHTLRYLRDRHAAERPVAQAYDRVIQTCLRAKAHAAAATYAVEKRKALAPKAVAAWEYTGGRGRKWTWALYSDGSVDEGAGNSTWSLEGDRLVIVNKVTPNRPPEGYIDTGVLAPDGRSLKGQNQRGGMFTAEPVTKK